MVARENNISTISNSSEYFISDIEFASAELGRFDMLALRWLSSQRKNPSNCRPVLIEMKYGDGALGGNAGLLKHLQDFDTLISDGIKFRKLLDTIEKQFAQLDQLGLMTFNKIDKWPNIKINPDVRPEVILLLANHNPRSPKLKTILDDPQIDLYAHSEKFDLRFFVASFAGYALHTECMVTLDQFRKLLKDK